MAITTATATNALKHGILSKQVLLPSESHAEYSALLTSVTEQYNPVGAIEVNLTQDIVKYPVEKEAPSVC